MALCWCDTTIGHQNNLDESFCCKPQSLQHGFTTTRVLVTNCNKLEGDSNFSDLEKDCDVNGPLDLIKDAVCSTDESQELFLKMANSMVTLHRKFQ